MGMSTNEPQAQTTRVTRCIDCGGELSPELPQALCSRCALAQALVVKDELESEVPPRKRQAFHLDDYELIEEIARGGMGVVYKARHVRQDRLVAVKMMLFMARASDEFIKRFRGEAATAAALHHPNIVAIHEVRVQGEDHFLIMDYVDGPNLARLARERPLSPQRAAQYLKVIAEAIQYAHERGILHRDLKPSNILIDSNDQPRLTDFGLAKRLEFNSEAMAQTQLTATGDVLGSPAYMPPEQTLGARGKLGWTSDVYSMGATLYHLLTGRPPFGGGSLMETFHQVQHQEPVAPHLLNPSIPQDLETICLKCLEKEPHRRYESARSLAQDLDRWLRSKPIQARRLGPWSKINRWTRRNPMGATLIAALLIGLGVSLTLLQMLSTQKRAAEEADARTQRARAAVLDAFGVSGFWNKSTSMVKIPAEILAIASGVPSPPTNMPVERRTLGLLVEEDPASIVVGYAALLGALEQAMNQRRRIPVRFEIMLFKKNPVATDALINHEVDILKIGGNSYLKAKARDANIRLLVSQNPPKQGVIFVRDSSEIKTLSQLTGRSMAFGDRYSTISAWAYAHVVRAGVTNLQRVGILDSIAAFESDASVRTQLGILSSHLLTIQAVRTNGFDAGVSSESTFRRSSQGLRAILVFDSDPVWWVVRSGFPDDLHAELERALVGLRDPRLFSGISRRITHYLPASEMELNELRKAMENAGKYFGGENAKEE